MSSSFSDLRRLGQGIRVSLPTDENGLVGRRCPKPSCHGYFKVKFGTGVQGTDLPCHCAYCGYLAAHDEFLTEDQRDYLKSVMLREVSTALEADVKAWDRELRRSTQHNLIKLGVEFKGNLQPIHRYQEQTLETAVICDACTLQYSVYGVFAFCPDCGTHNSLQILTKNTELVQKQLAFAATVAAPSLAQQLIDDALENAVAAFDAFGRAACTAFAHKAREPSKASAISFQDIERARERVKVLFGLDLGAGLSTAEWDSVVRCFQKRHLLAHKMGVVDVEYLTRAKDPLAVVGRKISVGADEVRELSTLLRTVATTVARSLG